jgi:(heptosyl)LPS beta-1,4-glucosyltransferase
MALNANHRISVIINTLNEESNIADCIRSVQDLADEILVCDMNSGDRTVEIARAMGAKVISIPRFEGRYQFMRHAAISTATNEWIVVIDADERMTLPLKERLRQLVDDPTIDVVYVGVLFWYFGDWVYHGGFFSNGFPRVFRRDVFLSGYREQKIQAHNDWASLAGATHKVVLPLDYHYLHLAYPSIEKYICKTLGMYGRIEAEQYYAEGRRFSFFHLLLDPFKQLLYTFVVRGGYKDGTRGLILSVLYSVYRFSVWANLWFLETQKVSPEKKTDQRS